MRLVLGGMVAAMSLSLAACGDNGSSPSPTPTPTPTGTPTPTPSPTAVAYTTSETALQYTSAGQRVANTQAVAPAMGGVFGFDPAQNGYVFTLLNGTVNPSPSETVIFTPTSSKTCDVALTPALCFGGGFVFQQVPAGTGNYFMSRFLAGPGNPLLVLSFTSFGTFQEAVLDTAATSRFDLRPFAYGVTSPAGAIPTTGTATFNGVIIGQATGNKVAATGTSNVYKLTGTSQLVLNYAAGTATLKLTIHGDAVGCTTCSPDINVTYDSTAGTLASGVLTFTLPGGGSAKYFLAGGAAATTGTNATAAIPPTEVAGSFSLTAADPNEAGVTMVLAGAGGGLR